MSNDRVVSLLRRWSQRKQSEAADDRAMSTAAPIPDVETLDASSDYSRFLGPDIPAELRTRALRRLWQTSPELSCSDGLIDYSGDYTEAAAIVCSPADTAFRLGQGMLTDDEARAWIALGAAVLDTSGAADEPSAHVEDMPDGDGATAASATEETIANR